MIQVILAEEHPHIRRGIRRLLEKTGDIKILAEAKTREEAIRLGQYFAPDVLITDIGPSQSTDRQIVEKIRSSGGKMRVVFLSIYASSSLAKESLQNGATGYVLKSSVKEELPSAIRAAYQNATYLSPTISNGAAAELRPTAHQFAFT